MAYATVDDVIVLYRTLSTEEKEKVEAMLPIVSDLIDQEAIKVGKDIQTLLDEGKLLENTLKVVTVGIIKRVLTQTDQGMQFSQMSESALGYSVSGTFANAGGGIYLLNNEKKQLGLNRQRLGTIEIC